MSPKDLFAVSIAAMAVWFFSIGVIALLGDLGPFAYFFVGLTLLAVAGFIAKSGRIPGA